MLILYRKMSKKLLLITPISAPSANTRQQAFLDTPPETFDRQSYLHLATTLGIPAPSADRYIKKWIETGKIEKIEYGKYRKL